MRCEVLNCIENENGYCMCSSYVGIDNNGRCDTMRIVIKDEGTEEDEDDE